MSRIARRLQQSAASELFTPPVGDPNTVKIGTLTHPLIGTNVARGTSEIVRFTRTAEQTVTPTNQYGVEVVVSLTTNQVVSVNDRISSGSTTGTSIPAGHYVLSGHGVGSGYAGQWLLDNATVGATVELITVTVDITNFVATGVSSSGINLSWSYSGAALTNFTLRRNNTVIASPAAAARTYSDTGLSAGTNYTYTITANYSAGGTSNTASSSASTQGSAPSTGAIVVMWHHTWGGPALRNYPADVKNNLNHYSLGMAQSSQSGTGYVAYTSNNGQSNADHATDIRALVASGKPVVVGIGGAGSGGVTVNNSTHAQQLVSSVQSMVNTFGINGIDIDLETGSSSWTAQYLKEACLSLKSIYGSSFVIGVTTQMYGSYTAMWMNFLNTLGHANYDYTGPMLYDFPESRKSSTLIPVCLDKTNTMVSYGVPQNKILLGFMLQPAGNPNYSASESAQVILDSYNATKAQYPNIAGAFFWADDIDPGRNWEFSRQVAPYL